MATALEKYVWVIKKFTSPQGVRYTIPQLDAMWRKDIYFSGGHDLSKRTFHNYRNEIKDLFDIEIDCDNSGGYRYYISNPDAIGNNKYLQWAINAIAVTSMVMELRDVRNKVLLEECPAGASYFEDITKALKNNHKLKITHQKFLNGTENTYKVRPYAIKAYNQRWYLLCYVEETQEVRTFSLDRIKSLALIPKDDTLEKNKIQYESFGMPTTYDPLDYFSEGIGVWVNKDSEIKKVVVRAYGEQADYMRTLPWHSTQNEINTNNDYADFEFYISITRDLIGHILSKWNQVEVLEPQSLRDKIKTEAQNIVNRY